MRIVATSDFHGTLPEVPECDLLLIGGDICPVWNHDRQFQADWLRGEFSDWLDAVPATEIVWVAGNHDFVLQDWRNKRHKIDALPGFYLDNEAITTMGLKIWGSPYSNKFGNWAFMQKEAELVEMWREIPRDIDILIAHGPPYGFGDECLGFSATKRGMLEAEHVGSTSLANQLYYDVWPNLKLVMFGHIHEGYGAYSMKQFRMLNVSQMNDKYEPVNPPMVIDLW
jgi:Icc-related predicted phosphoesterase